MADSDRRTSPVLLLAIEVTAVLVVVLGLALLLAQPASASPALEETWQQPGNDTCLACHGQPGQALTLPSGEILPTTVDPAVFALSAHGTAGVACTDCHRDITGYPHPPLAANDRRDFTLAQYPLCQECHDDKYTLTADSVHQQVLSAGNKNAAVCADCHNPHAQPLLTNPNTGQMDLVQRANIPNTCAGCHNAIFGEYVNSVHGNLLLTTGNVDVPTCTECHGVHSIPDPRTAEFRLSSPQMCGNCHTDPVKMAKYGLSTAVLDTYVADFHGTTVTLFQKIEPDQPVNKPVCYDCHGVHNIAATNDPVHGIAVKENMLVSCQRCHPDATENFPTSWLSHYIPSPRRNPLVFYVQLFYYIFIPAVLGIMAVFVVTDFYRKIRASRREERSS